MNDGGFIRLYRKMLFSEVASYGVVTLGLAVIFLLRARWEKETGFYMGRELKRGQGVFGRQELAALCDVGERVVRTSVERLVNCGFMTIETTNKFTVFTIVNWTRYQGLVVEVTNGLTNNRPTGDQRKTNNRPTTDHVQESKTVRRKKVITEETDRVTDANVEGDVGVGDGNNRSVGRTVGRSLRASTFTPIKVRSYEAIWDSANDAVELACSIDGTGERRARLFFVKHLALVGDERFRGVLAEVWGEWNAGEIKRPGAVLSNRLKELVGS